MAIFGFLYSESFNQCLWSMLKKRWSEHDFRRVNEHELLEKLKTEYKWVHEDPRKSLILVVGHIILKWQHLWKSTACVWRENAKNPVVPSELICNWDQHFWKSAWFQSKPTKKLTTFPCMTSFSERQGWNHYRHKLNKSGNKKNMNKFCKKMLK